MVEQHLSSVLLVAACSISGTLIALVMRDRYC